MQVPKIHGAESPTYGLTEIGTTFNGIGNICECQRRVRLGGSGGMLPQEIFKCESLKTPFSALSGQ